MTTGTIVAAVLCAMVAVGLAIWLIPRWQVHRWRRAGISNEEKLAELGVQARSSITQALGGLALIVTLAITAFQVNEARRSADKTQKSAADNLRLATLNLRLTEQGQVSERFSRAVDQLGATNKDGSPATDVRTGALFSLMRIGIDFETHRQPALLVAISYVTNNYRAPTAPRPHGCRANFRHVRKRPDIATALGFVLHKIAAKLDERELSGLRGADLNGLALDGLILNRFNLRNVKLRDASLVRAHFHNAQLPFADLGRACLTDADFSGASLQGANFRQASLHGANFRGAHLKGAKFTQGDLDQTSLSKAQRREVVLLSP